MENILSAIASALWGAPVLILLGITAVCGAAAIVSFRWE